METRLFILVRFRIFLFSMADSPSRGRREWMGFQHLLAQALELRFVYRWIVGRETILGRVNKMATSSKDWKIPEAALLTYCYNLDCLRPFHLIPGSEEEEKFFKELLVDRNARGPAKLRLICPRCGAFVEVLASDLEVCTCGQEPHNPPYKP